MAKGITESWKTVILDGTALKSGPNVGFYPSNMLTNFHQAHKGEELGEPCCLWLVLDTEHLLNSICNHLNVTYACQSHSVRQWQVCVNRFCQIVGSIYTQFFFTFFHHNIFYPFPVGRHRPRSTKNYFKLGGYECLSVEWWISILTMSRLNALLLCNKKSELSGYYWVYHIKHVPSQDNWWPKVYLEQTGGHWKHNSDFWVVKSPIFSQ